jgi:hypothetical protein
MVKDRTVAKPYVSCGKMSTVGEGNRCTGVCDTILSTFHMSENEKTRENKKL